MEGVACDLSSDRGGKGPSNGCIAEEEKSSEALPMVYVFSVGCRWVGKAAGHTDS